ALLTATPPPVPPEAKVKIEPPSKNETVSDVQVRLTLDPGAAGANAYQVNVARNNQPIAGAKVRLQFAYPPLDLRSGWLTLDDGGDGSYFGAGPELERAGNWDALVDVTIGRTNQAVRAAFEWPLPENAPTSNTRQPTILNWLSVLGIVIAAGV